MSNLSDREQYERLDEKEFSDASSASTNSHSLDLSEQELLINDRDGSVSSIGNDRRENEIESYKLTESMKKHEKTQNLDSLLDVSLDEERFVDSILMGNLEDAFNEFEVLNGNNDQSEKTSTKIESDTSMQSEDPVNETNVEFESIDAVNNYSSENSSQLQIQLKSPLSSPTIKTLEDSTIAPDTPENILKSIEVVKQTVSELAQYHNVNINKTSGQPQIDAEENGQIGNALLLHEIFRKFCSPAPTLDQILAVLKQIDPNRKDCHEIHYNSDFVTCNLPQDTVIAVGEGGTPVVRLLTRNVSGGLLALPKTFQLAFFCILIRLLMSETGDEYMQYFGETLHLDKNLENASQVTEKTRNSTKRKSLSSSEETTLKGDFLYSIVRFRCAAEWERFMSNFAMNKCATAFLNVPGQGAMVAILHILRTLLATSCNDDTVAPVIRLLGIVGVAGMSPHLLRQILDLMSKPQSIDDEAGTLLNANKHANNVDSKNNALPNYDASIYDVPDSARLSLIRALCFAVKCGSQSTRLLGKASPRCFFNFGNGSGLSTVFRSWPLKNEYGFATWFRFDSLPPDSTIVSFRAGDGTGVDVTLEALENENTPSIGQNISDSAAILVISVYSSSFGVKERNQANQVRLKGCVLCPRIWYHLAVRHTEPRYRGYFSNASDEVTVFVDGMLMLTDELKFPKTNLPPGIGNKLLSPALSSAAPSHVPVKIEFAKNFDGQTGALYFFKENVSDATIQALFDVTSGTKHDFNYENIDKDWSTERGDLARRVNLLTKEVFSPTNAKSGKNSNASTAYRGNGPINGSLSASLANLPDKGLDDDPDEFSLHPLSKTSFAMKLLLVWDPSRAFNGIILDGYSGANAVMDFDTVQPWYVVGAKDIISSIGGIQSLLPLFETFLVPASNNHDNKVANIDNPNILEVEQERESYHQDESLGESERLILPNLITLLAIFIKNDDENCQELLRCGGIDIIEHYIFTNKMLSLSLEEIGRENRRYKLLVKKTSESISAASNLVDALENLRVSASHNAALESKIFSRLIFNVPLWLGGTIKTFGIALFTVLLPYLSSVAIRCPEKVRDCVDMRDLFLLINELVDVRRDTNSPPQKAQSNLFDRYPGSDAPLHLSERRHAVDVAFGIFVVIISSKSTETQLSPFLNFIAYNLDDEWEKASADGQSERLSNTRKGTRKERYIATCKACSILLFLLQKQPPIAGIHSSFEKCFSNANGIASFILCGMVNSFDDFIRSLGIRCLTKFLDGVNGYNKIHQGYVNSKYDKYSIDINKQENEFNSSVGSKQESMSAASTLSKTMKYVGSGLRNMRAVTMYPNNLTLSKPAEKIIHKLLWHLLKCHRDVLDDLSHAALADLLLDSGQDYLTSSPKPFSLDDVICVDHILQGGFRFNDEWAKLPTTPVGIDSSQNLRNIFAVGVILRLLRFLPDRMKERWLFDLLALIRISPRSIKSMLPSKDWQPCLFHLLSESVEEINKHNRTCSEKSKNEDKHQILESAAEDNENADLKQDDSSDKVQDSIVHNPDDDTNVAIVNESIGEDESSNITKEKDVHSDDPETHLTTKENIISNDLSPENGLSMTTTPSSPHVNSIRARFDLVLKLYSILLGHGIRQGGNKTFKVIEQAASIQRVCVNGHEVFSILLSHLLAEFVENGTVVDVESLSFPEQSNPSERNRALKQSARIVTTALLSNGTEVMDMKSAVNQWKSLRYLTAITVAVITKSGFGVADLFSYNTQNASSIEIHSGGLCGIRLPDGNVAGLSASTYQMEPEDHRISCVTLAAQLLSLLDAFIFPDSLDASLPASQLHGLDLVRSKEERLGKAQGSLLASLIRISFLLIGHLEPSSIKFLQCCSRLRCFLHWTLELIRESVALGGYSAAFQELTAPLDRLVLAVVLQCHRALSKCAYVLLEIESSPHDKYFANKDERQKNIKRLFRSTSELREIVLAAYRGRNEVLRSGLSLQAYEALQSGLEDIMALKKGNVPRSPEGGHQRRSKESSLRGFMNNSWVEGFHDVVMYGDISIPESVSDGQLYRNRTASSKGRKAIQELAEESKMIVVEYDHALNEPFQEYCEGQRLWAETDAVRDMEYDGDLAVKRLAHGFKMDISDTKRIESHRTNIASYKLNLIHQSYSYPWSFRRKNKNESQKFWKLAEYPDRLHRRILLIHNQEFNNHEDSSYEGMIGKDRGRRLSASNEIDSNNTEVLRRASEGIVPYKPPTNVDVDGEKIDDSDVNSDVLRQNSGSQDIDDEIERESLQDDSEEPVAHSEWDSEWDYVESNIGHPDLSNDINTQKDKLSWSKALMFTDDEKPIQLFETVTLVSLQTLSEGLLLLTTHGLYFHPTSEEIDVMTKEKIDSKGSSLDEKNKRWRLCGLTEVHARLYMLRQQALEFFFADTKELFISFNNGKNARDRFYARLRASCKVPMLRSHKVLNPRLVFKRSKITDLWRRRKISNFEYIMQLNLMAGRTFNDITQYPVFPWVLTDYTSETLDLTDPQIYRDLSKPVGALNPNRLEQLIERFNDLDGFPEEEKFLYGSHYSSPGVVLHYLIRQEPFTTMAIELQSGRFDCPDRLFYDLAGSWKSCMTSTSDVKELIPEFFTCPEIFMNTNKFPLGETQTKIHVDDVILPPWANGSAYEFVRIHRLALESDFVSENLHHWIDLIFGYKQRGPEAAAAYNMFHFLSYEGSVDLDKITDEVDRRATESHIQNFGQTPSQLLVKEPHSVRYPMEDCWNPIFGEMLRLRELRCFTPQKQFRRNSADEKIGAILSIHVFNDTVIVVYDDLNVGTYKWSTTGTGNTPFSFRMEKIKALGSKALSLLQADNVDPGKTYSQMQSHNNGTSKSLVGEWSFGVTLGGSVMDNLARRADGQKPNEIGSASKVGNTDASILLISCGYWDETLKIHSSDGLRLKCSENGGHRGPITCLSIGDDGGLMITGGQDATCRVWAIDHLDMATAISNGYTKLGSGYIKENGKTNLLSCCHILWGHEAAISCVDFCSDLDVKVSGSIDGIICVHSVRQGIFIRTIHVGRDAVDIHDGAMDQNHISHGHVAVRKLALNEWGEFAAHFDDGMLHTFTINGIQLRSTYAGEKLHAMKMCSEGKMLVTGGENGNVVVRSLHDLAVQYVIDLSSHGPIRCISFTPATLNPSPQYMFVGTNDGKVTIVDRDPLQKDEQHLEGGLPMWTVHDGSSLNEGGTWWRERRSSNRRNVN